MFWPTKLLYFSYDLVTFVKIQCCKTTRKNGSQKISDSRFPCNVLREFDAIIYSLRFDSPWLMISIQCY